MRGADLHTDQEARPGWHTNFLLDGSIISAPSSGSRLRTEAEAEAERDVTDLSRMEGHRPFVECLLCLLSQICGK